MIFSAVVDSSPCTTLSVGTDRSMCGCLCAPQQAAFLRVRKLAVGSLYLTGKGMCVQRFLTFTCYKVW